MAPQPPIKFRDLSQSGDGLTNHSSSSKATVPDSACVPGNDGLAETGFDLQCGDGEVRSRFTLTKAEKPQPPVISRPNTREPFQPAASVPTKSVGDSTVQQPVTARPNDRPAQVECPTYDPGKGPIVKGPAIYNGGTSGRFGSI